MEVSFNTLTIALLMAADLQLCDTHFPTISELNQFVLPSPTGVRCTLESLTSVLREDFRKREKREIFERDVI